MQRVLVRRVARQHAHRQRAIAIVGDAHAQFQLGQGIARHREENLLVEGHVIDIGRAGLLLQRADHLPFFRTRLGWCLTRIPLARGAVEPIRDVAIQGHQGAAAQPDLALVKIPQPPGRLDIGADAVHPVIAVAKTVFTHQAEIAIRRKRDAQGFDGAHVEVVLPQPLTGGLAVVERLGLDAQAGALAEAQGRLVAAESLGQQAFATQLVLMGFGQAVGADRMAAAGRHGRDRASAEVLQFAGVRVLGHPDQIMRGTGIDGFHVACGTEGHQDGLGLHLDRHRP